MLQKEFDRNIDIFDRYVKKNVAAVAAATIPARPDSAGTAAAAAAGGWVNNGAVAPAACGRGARAASELAGATAPAPAAGARAGGGSGDEGYLAASSAKGGAAQGTDGADAWALDVEESAPPKRLEEEEALDAEIQQLRKRRRKVDERYCVKGSWGCILGGGGQLDCSPLRTGLPGFV